KGIDAGACNSRLIADGERAVPDEQCTCLIAGAVFGQFRDGRSYLAVIAQPKRDQSRSRTLDDVDGVVHPREEARRPMPMRFRLERQLDVGESSGAKHSIQPSTDEAVTAERRLELLKRGEH